MRLASARRTLVIAASSAGLVLIGAILVRRHPHAPPAPVEAPAALKVEVSGCAAVLRGPVCQVGRATEIRLWLPGVEDGAIRVTAGGAEVPVTVTAWPDGRTVRLVVPQGAARLDVHARLGARDAIGDVRVAPWPPIPPAVAQAKALRRAGHLDEAAASLASMEDAGGEARAALLSDRARLELQQGQIEATIADLREAITLHWAEGNVSEAADDASALTFVFLDRNRFAEARQVLAQETALSRDYPDGLAGIVHDEGLIAGETGDLRTALRRAREAEARFARLGMEFRRRVAALTVGLRLTDLGRYTESIAIFRALLESKDADGCERADLLNNEGWSALLASEAASDTDLGLDAREPLAQARDVLQASCPDPNRMANVLVNLALGELQHGRLTEARAALDGARKAEHDPPIPVVLFWQHLAGRIALASGALSVALASFTREAEIASALGSAEDRLSAAEATAATLVALGRRTLALAALDEADALVDQLSPLIPLGEGMEGFFAARDRAAVRRIDLLVQLGRPDDAMNAARHWRARVLDWLRVTASLEHLDPAERVRWEDAVGRYRALRATVEKDTAGDWELPSDRLAAARARREEAARQARSLLDDALSVLPRARPQVQQPAPLPPDVLELLFVPAPTGWLGFARTAAGLWAERMGRIDPRTPAADLARTLLGPFDAAIAKAQTIRFLPYGSTRAIDLHALPWSGRPLLEHAVVEYSLGLDDATTAEAQPTRALVVADPGGDLPAARGEADSVTAALAGAGWKVVGLRGMAADGQTVRDALGSADLLHYAGHATAGGADGVDSALSLARGSRLTPADILALPRVPGVVGLFGCETAQESATGALDALGLTSAFLVGGAHFVVATSRVVEDSLARDVAAGFYARLTAAPTPDAPRALRDAVLAVRDRDPAVDWAAFRVLVP